MVCNPSAFSDGGRLGIIQIRIPPRKKRKVTVRIVTAVEVEARLKEERSRYIAEHPSLNILGNQFVCPDNVICSKANFISRLNDMNVFCLT